MSTEPFDRILGASSGAEAIRRFGRRAAAVDAPVLLLGESGTGKGVLARAIHDASRRTRSAFVAVNCAAVPDSLFESEFFGHVRGAFTGAQYAHKGLFEQAHAGTLFLDEVGELSPAAQAKLLTAIEDRQVRRVGGERQQLVDVRVIAATACDLALAVAEKRFRNDLFHRLSVLSFRIAPLRERAGDIELLAHELITTISARYGRPAPVPSSEALERLVSYDWPGNIRELANTLERALVHVNNGTLSHRCVSFMTRSGHTRVLRPALARSRYSFAGSATEELEHIANAIAACAGNKTRAAELLGMSRNTLLNKLRLVHGRKYSRSPTLQTEEAS